MKKQRTWGQWSGRRRGEGERRWRMKWRRGRMGEVEDWRGGGGLETEGVEEE